jgi:hypothetical protein
MLYECLAVLRKLGILLQSDPQLPSVTTIVAGESIRGSWWGHQAAGAIYATLQLLGRHPEVLSVKLVAGKDTFVHRRLWPAIYAIGTAGESWQRTGLSSAARSLEMELNEVGQLQTTGAAAKELQLRFLAHGEQFHTAAGSHATRLESWLHWAQRLGLDMEQVSPHEAKAAIEAILPSAKFLWSSKLRMHR